MKKTTILNLAIIATIIYTSLSVLIAFTPIRSIDTYVVVSKDAFIIKKNIQDFSILGYKVQSISCQSIAFAGRTGTDKGPIILVMVKY